MTTVTATVTALDDITYTRPELTEVLPQYTLITDCVKQLVKSKTTTYLPMPSTEENAADNTERYNAYILRAVFYAVTAHTLVGMVGQVYAKAVEIVLPDALAFIADDATGSGLSLAQLSKDSLTDVASIGRAGIFVDYPITNGAVTQKQVDDGTIRPTFTTYSGESVRNWRHKKRDAKLVKTLVVLKETAEVENEFSIELRTRYRELRLNDDVYQVRTWTEDDKGKFVATEWLTPLQSNQKPFDEIPFEFMGAMNNDATVDEPPLRTLSEINVAHYRNSADYEEACFITGQPTPWFSGLTEDWVNDVLKGKVLLGSRSAVLMPELGQAGLLQVQPNSMPMEAMKHKEAQMVALGAKLVENRAVRRTLGEVSQSNASEASALASAANNVSAAFTSALRFAARFVGAPMADILFKLSTDFALTAMAPEDRTQLIVDMQAGALSPTEVRYQLRRVGLAVQDDATAFAEIEKANEAKAKREADAKAAAPAPAKIDQIDNRAK